MTLYGSIVQTWLYNASQLLIVATIMISVIKHFRTLAVPVPRWVIPVHAVYLVVFSMLVTCLSSVYTVMEHRELDGYYYSTPVLVIADRRILVTTNAVEVFGILMADTSMLMLLARYRTYWPRVSRPQSFHSFVLSPLT